jgi:hypothetical protein
MDASRIFLFHMHIAIAHCMVHGANVVDVVCHNTLVLVVHFSGFVFMHVLRLPFPQDTARTTSPFCRTKQEQPRPPPGCVHRGLHDQTSAPRPSGAPSLRSHTVGLTRTTTGGSFGYFHLRCPLWVVRFLQYPPLQVCGRAQGKVPNNLFQSIANPAHNLSTLLLVVCNIVSHFRGMMHVQDCPSSNLYTNQVAR